MLKKLTTLSMALLFPVMASAYAPKKEALLVGVEQYKSGESLPGIGLDIKRMRELLEKRGFHVRVLFNQDATSNNVKSALYSYRNLSSNDTFFFYDSSHGTQVPDLNGDEKDGKDEAYVLYDANFNISNEEGLLIDDQLERLLAYIPAKKVMFVDTCHSGTSYKSFSRNAVTKSKRVASNFKYKSTKGILGTVPKVQNLVVLTASSDKQKSIATSEGSLFTEAVYNSWRVKPNITFKGLQQEATKQIANACRRDNDLVPSTPNLFTTNQVFINTPINDFLQVNVRVNPTKYLVEEYLDGLMAQGKVGQLGLNSKNYYNKGEHITLNIDTLGQQGHLYILTSKESENEIDVLYPNPYYQNVNEVWRGRFTFPSTSKPFALQATNNSSGLERTVIYAILSESVIPELEVSRVGYNKFQSIFKDLNGQSNLKGALKDILIKRKQNRISIAKVAFSVGK